MVGAGGESDELQRLLHRRDGLVEAVVACREGERMARHRAPSVGVAVEGGDRGHPFLGLGRHAGIDAIADRARLGLDPGASSVLEAYQRARYFDTVSTIAATDGLFRLFSNDSGPLRLLRDFGLGLVDRFPALKRRFMREADGSVGSGPSLLKGVLP